MSESEQAVAAYFHLSRSLNKRDKYAAARDKIREAVRVRREGEAGEKKGQYDHTQNG